MRFEGQSRMSRMDEKAFGRAPIAALRFSAPLHPILVHFTIALPVISYLFDLLSAVTHAPALRAAGWWNLAAAVAITFATIATGISSRLRLPVEEGEARAMLRTHMALGPIVLGLLLAIGAWRAHLWRLDLPIPWTYLLAMSGVIVVVAAQGYLGGELVYRYGAEVKSHYRLLTAAQMPSRQGR
jgi:uncharacterized membrane protein